MTSLDGILQRHGSVLIVDCASSVVQVGLLRRDEAAHWFSREGEAGTALFAGVQYVVGKSAFSLNEMGAFAFNHGPGSILGIRTSAVALRSWSALYPRTCYAFNGLALFALGLGLTRAKPFAVIADARRESWHRVMVGADGNVGPCLRLPTTELAGDLIHPEEFRAWSARPAQVEEVPYSLEGLICALPDSPVFSETDAPDAFLHEEPSYQTWTPHVHRAPS